MTSHETFPTTEQCITKIKEDQTSKLYEYILTSIYSRKLAIIKKSYQSDCSSILVDVLKNLHLKGYKIVGQARKIIGYHCTIKGIVDDYDEIIHLINYESLLVLDFTQSPEDLSKSLNLKSRLGCVLDIIIIISLI
jgi:hypothetical protein